MLRQLALVATFLMASFTTVKVRAHVELNTFYTSESLSMGSNSTNSRMFIEGAIGFSIDKKSTYLVGWNYSMMTTSDAKGSDTTSYSSTQMGPRFLWFMTKDKSWSLGLGYYLVTTATFSTNGGESVKWRGTALKADVGYNFPVSENLYLGIRLNYSSATYSEKIEGETELENVSYAKTAMYPSLYAVYVF
ncbi:MAG TPA: hypothetical protein VM432_07870 [Bdellovibrionales bacterium]|nr:hypothetical protein [Bdellovibrionales bacterium]